ncbi:MAG: hypothetical protein GY820_31640 [Gammaproteobacteria bacterium]|nr:hypothetical protein [Gammaproteobacteria bacterium]
MEKTISVAKSLPYTFALVSGVFVASYMFTGMFAESSIGRPSSTAALGFIFAPIYTLIVAFIGFIIGIIPRFFLKKRGDKDLVKKSSYLIKIAIITILIGAISGGIAVKQVIDYEAYNSPHLLSNKANFIKTMYSENDIPSISNKAKLVWEYDNTNIGPFTWNQLSLTPKVHNSTQLLISSDDQNALSYNFNGYTYVTEVSLLPINNTDNSSYLAVLVRLRATSFRSMLLIYDNKFNLVYEELLDRCGRKQYMGSTATIEGEAITVNICEPFTINVK